MELELQEYERVGGNKVNFIVACDDYSASGHFDTALNIISNFHATPSKFRGRKKEVCNFLVKSKAEILANL